MIRLVEETPAMLDALEAPETFRDRFGADVGLHAETAREVVKQTLEFQQGLATAMAEKLVEIAAVLEKAGFGFAGELEDAEDGTIWRWRKELGS